MLKLHFLGACLLVALSAPIPAIAQQRSAVREGYKPEDFLGKKVVLFRPLVSVGSQSTGGVFSANAEWTEKAKKNLTDALADYQKNSGNTLLPFPELVGDDVQKSEEFIALFGAIAYSVEQYQFFVGNRLPTKKKDNKNKIFDWSLGDSIKNLPGTEGADYALFVFDHDEYGSTGRKVLQVVAILGAGVALTSGVHGGFAGLVDLKNGNLVWLNANGRMGGDVREFAGAEKRVRELLQNVPFGKIETSGAK